MALYVMSDIHGQLKAFDEMLLKIEFSDEDTLYLLGDYVDWGEESVKLILRIIELQRKFNIVCIMGNHDKLFLDVISHIKNRTDKMEMYEEAKSSRKFSLYMRNGGEKTICDYLNLSAETADTVRNWLERLVYFVPDVEINGRKYYLCHSKPLVGDMDEDDMIWDRVINKYSLTLFQKKYPDTTLISGHTIVNRFNSFNDDGSELRIYRFGYIPCINVDCGGKIFARSKRDGYGYGVLACLRLDDEREFYVSPNISDDV